MRVVLWMVAVIAVLVAAAVAYALSPSEIDPIEPPSPDSFDPAVAERGERLALLGNCNECHTVEGGTPYAGGRPLATPFGTIYGTNITPDAETGIGAWSEEAFQRAMRRGLDREGRHLYPAFPYNHFALLSDEDVSALYAYFMTRRPVRSETPENDLPFPLNQRPILAGWKLLFLDDNRYEDDPSLGDEANRGGYLVRGIGHCGACHTPRNVLQAERRGQFLRGGETEGWHAPALLGDVPTAVPWTEDTLTAYLRNDWTAHHGVAAGPMRPVVRNVARVPEEDAQSMSAYILALRGEPSSEAQARGARLVEEAGRQAGIAAPAVTPAAGDAEPGSGEAIYRGACAQCHQGGVSRYAGGRDLRLSTSVRAPDPRNLIHLIRQGLQPPEGEEGFYMPGFDAALTDEQIVALASFLREDLAGLPAWPGLADTVANVRRSQDLAGVATSATVPLTEEASRPPATN
jgi:mono/diheme cytochrome c family protein